MLFWRVWIYCCMFAIALPTWAEAGYGLLRGLATCTDGVPYATQPVSLRSNVRSWTVMTQADGSFGCLAPVGNLAVGAPGCAECVTIAPGELTVIKITVRRTGIQLISDAPRISANDRLDIEAVAWTTHDGSGTTALPCPERRGTTWFPDVPPDAHAFSVTLWWEKLHEQFVTVYTWTFTKPEVIRSLRIPLGAQLSMPQITLVDAQGKPLANTEVEGSLSWELHGANPASVECQLVGLQSSPLGKLSLPQYWLPGTYHLSLTINGVTGPQIPLDYSGNGTLKPATYPFKKAQ